MSLCCLVYFRQCSCSFIADGGGEQNTNVDKAMRDCLGKCAHGHEDVAMHFECCVLLLSVSQTVVISTKLSPKLATSNIFLLQTPMERHEWNAVQVLGPLSPTWGSLDEVPSFTLIQSWPSWLQCHEPRSLPLHTAGQPGLGTWPLLGLEPLLGRLLFQLL